MSVLGLTALGAYPPEESAQDEAARLAIVWRMRRAAVCAAIFALSFVQSAGLIAPDTKLDLTQDPSRFMARALDMWDPAGFAGQLQNQAYGYLFPIGPFFAGGDLAGLPSWVTQRLWWGVVLCVAFLGVTTLARKLDIGSPGTQLLAGVAFALSPRMISTLGPVSAEAWPMALAPWVVVPLVGATVAGGLRRPAMISALVVALMGGVNAALCLAAVLPAGLYLATRRPGARSLRLLGWWTASVVAATLWWVVPLLLLGRYSPPFLDYIETGDVTTSPTSLIQSLRGASQWVAYLGPQLGSGWQAGHDLVSQPALILDTVVVVAIGLIGLSLKGIRERGWLVVVLLAGCLAVTFGHVGEATAWFAADERSLLDGALAPLRNVHKFDPLIRLPVVLGLAHAATVLPQWLRRLEGGRFAAVSVLSVMVVAVVGVGAPAYVGRVAPSGSFAEVPAYWDDAGAWLDEHPGGRTLLLPGSRFALYGWGSTMDEPIQALTDAPWEVRNAIPLVPAGHIRLLDGVEQALAAGGTSPGLAAYLSRAGISRVLVRNDLNVDSSGATRPLLVHQVLESSPGFSLVAAFGPEIGQPASNGIYVDDGLREARYPAIEVYALDDAGGPVTLTPASSLVEVTGGPESLLDLADHGLLPAGPTVLSAQLADGLIAPRVALTDGLQRREVDFGGALGNESRVLSADDPLRLNRPQRDYSISDDPADLTVAEWQGVEGVTVSSSLADAGNLGGAMSAAGPAAAFDQSTETAWLTKTVGDEPAWIDVRLLAPTELDRLTIELPRTLASALGAVRVITAAERVEGAVAPDGQQLTVELSGASIDGVRVELFRRPGTTAPLGIAELTLPGIFPRQVLVPPPLAFDSDQQQSAITLVAPAGHRDSCVVGATVQCAPLLARQGEEDHGVYRRIELTDDATYAVTVSAAPVPGSWLNSLIQQSEPSALSARATSSLVDDPLGGAQAAVDGDSRTGWVAGPFDPDPGLTLSSPRRITVSGLELSWSDELAASRPSTVTVDAGDRTWVRPVDDDGHVELPVFRANAMTLHFADLVAAYTYDPGQGVSQRLPVGLSDIEVEVEASRPSGPALLDNDTPVTLECGQGPVLTIDGVDYDTRVATTVGRLASLGDVPADLCTAATVSLPAGTHDIELAGAGDWRPVAVSMSSDDWDAADDASLPVDVKAWGSSERMVSLGNRDVATVLSVQENANSGWVATMDGETLNTLELDGWKQGYLVPAGAAADVRLEFRPATPYRIALWLGLGLLVALFAAALIRAKSSDLDPAEPLSLPVWTVAVAALAVSVALGGVAGAAVWLVVAGSAYLVGRAVGPDRTVVDLGWALSAGVLVGVAGVVLALSNDRSDTTAQRIVQLGCLAAIAVVSMAALRGAARPPADSSVDDPLE